jgi:beta-galactosidase
MVLSASADGLKSARIQLISKPFSSTKGLSLEMPSDGLPADLSRGPTPPGESYKPTRQPIEVARVAAGSNIERAISSIDDNEATDWSSDGQPNGAWITYEFSRPAKIDQVVMKLVGWRTQSYPLQISIDRKVVFTGNSPRSLGYVNFTFPPTIGKSVKIELRGEASNRDAFGNIVEIQGAPDPKSSANKGGKNILGIVEAEFYAPLN